MINAQERIEAEALRRQYEQVLRLLEGRQDSPLTAVLLQIRKETGKSVYLLASSCFTRDQTLPFQPSEFSCYKTMLKEALDRCSDVSEYTNWQFRYTQFQAGRYDFEVVTLIFDDIVRQAERLSKWQEPPRNKKLQKGSSNKTRFLLADRVFLQELHIGNDFESFAKPASRQI